MQQLHNRKSLADNCDRSRVPPTHQIALSEHRCAEQEACRLWSLCGDGPCRAPWDMLVWL